IVVRNTGNVTLTAIVVRDDNAEIVSDLPIASLAPNATATVIEIGRASCREGEAGTVVDEANETGADQGCNPTPAITSYKSNTPQPNDPTVVELTQISGLTHTKR